LGLCFNILTKLNLFYVNGTMHKRLIIAYFVNQASANLGNTATGVFLNEILSSGFFLNASINDLFSSIIFIATPLATVLKSFVKLKLFLVYQFDFR